MEITYKIIATDGKEYGPVNLEQLQGWINEGRIASDTQLLRSDINEWRPASSFAEISVMMAGGSSTPALTPAASALPVTEASPELFELEKRVKSGGSWYYWVAALSLVNSVMAFSGGGGGFVIGLSVTQFVEAMLSADGGVMKGVGLALGVLAAGVFALFGVFACKRHVCGRSSWGCCSTGSIPFSPCWRSNGSVSRFTDGFCSASSSARAPRCRSMRSRSPIKSVYGNSSTE